MTRDSNGRESASPGVHCPPPKWIIRQHDSFRRGGRWDKSLRKGMNLILESAGLKKENTDFDYEKQDVFVSQDKNQCALMTATKLIVILTGETLADRHWLKAADVLRVFFYAWLYRDAEHNGAIAEGYLHAALSQAVKEAADGTTRNVDGGDPRT